MNDPSEKCDGCGFNYLQTEATDRLLHTPDDPEYAFPGAVLCTLCQLRALEAAMGDSDAYEAFRTTVSAQRGGG